MMMRVLALIAVLAGMKVEQQDTGMMARVEGVALDLGCMERILENPIGLWACCARRSTW